MAKEIWKRIDPEEELFQKCLLDFHGIESCKSTGKIDMEWHIDLYLGNGLSVDVKSQKKVNGLDKKPSEEFTWIEFNNSSGRRGWLYGRASHIAFAMEDYYLVVDRRHLVDYSAKVLEANGLINRDGKLLAIIKTAAVNYEPYKVYTRNNLDKVMLVEIADLKGLTHLIVKRDADRCRKKS